MEALSSLALFDGVGGGAGLVSSLVVLAIGNAGIYSVFAVGSLVLNMLAKIVVGCLCV